MIPPQTYNVILRYSDLIVNVYSLQTILNNELSFSPVGYT